VSSLYLWEFNKNLSRGVFHESIDNGGSLVYHVRAEPSSAIMKDWSMVV
jgi:hypothetical protein